MQIARLRRFAEPQNRKICEVLLNFLKFYLDYAPIGAKISNFHSDLPDARESFPADGMSVAGPSASKLTDTLYPSSISRACQHIHEHLGESLSLAVLARSAGLSQAHFCRLFKETTGHTPTVYVNQARIAWAKEELRRLQRPVAKIAEHVGYRSISQFHRCFARFVGCSPSAYRRSQLQNADF